MRSTNSPTSIEDLSGTNIKGYELLERIGAGGFGAVYRARQTTIDREVAIKIILPGWANNPEFIRRFEVEAQLIARLEHPHITPLHDYWRDPSGAYLVMRYLRGGSIRDMLQNDAYDLESSSRVLDQVASALDLAHRNEVIHRDIKPGNILLDEDGNSYLADFGIAKDLTASPDAQTAPDAVLGSLDYISPEQARNELVSPRTDIYSLGVTLYEMITGEHPFKDSSSVEKLYHHINDPLPLITDLTDNLDDDINTVIQTATAKDPLKRYTDVLAFAIAFRESIGREDADRELQAIEQLTLREHEVLQLIVQGLTNREIADKLFVTVATVRWHIRQLYKKLGVRSRVQAIVRARELDLIHTNAVGVSEKPTMSGSTVISLPEPENPYKGLRSFQMSDAADFFGRETLVEKLLDRLSEEHRFSRFLAVVGPSGSGKSSLVRAGLIPALWQGKLPRSEKWFVVDMIPGTRPLDQLEVALVRVVANQNVNLREQLARDENGLLRVADIILPQDDTELVLVIDQFEEVFTLAANDVSCTQFLALLHAAVTDPRSRVRVIVTLRADYYDRPLHYPDFGELMRSRMETVLPLSAQGLDQAITGPAQRVGVTLEDGLVAQIVSEMNYQAGALPLLQYALTELFDRRQGRVLTHEAYRAIGGAVGALAHQADEILYSLDEGGQVLARQMFLRLVTLGEQSDDTRRRVPRSELLALTADTDLMDEIIDAFADERLLTLDHDPTTRRPTVEVAHEAILHEWTQLRKWLNDSRHDIRQQRLLAAATDEWLRADRDASYLLRGSRLDQFVAWAEVTDIALTVSERTFVETSVAEQQHLQESERDRQQRELETQRKLAAQQRRAANRLRYLVAAMGIFLIVALGLALFAFDREQQAQDERDKVQRQADVNRSLVIADKAEEAHEAGHSNLSLALALEAVSIDDPPADAVRALKTAATGPGTRAYLEGHQYEVTAIAFTPDGKRALSSSCADISADEVCTRGEMILWDVDGPVDEVGKILRLEGHTDWINSVAISPDGSFALSGSSDGTLARWDISPDSPTYGEIVATFEGHTGGINQVAISADGTTALSGSDDKTIILWDVTTQTILRNFAGHTGSVNDVSFSPDGQTFVSASQDTTLMLWDMATGEPLQTFEGHTSEVLQGLFTLDGSKIISGAYDMTTAVWDVTTGTRIRQDRHTNVPRCLDVLPDGQSILMCATSMIIAFDITSWSQIDAIMSRPQDANTTVSATMAINAVGSHLLLGHENGNIAFLNYGTQAETHRFTEPGAIFGGGVAVSPNQPYLLTGSWGTGTVLWDINMGTLLRRFDDARLVTNEVVFSPDGRLFAASSDDFVGGTSQHSLVVWDVETGQEVSRFEGHEYYTHGIAFSPDGTRILSGSFVSFYSDVFIEAGGDSGDLYLWDVETGKAIHEFDYDNDVGCIDFRSDGKQALVGTWSKKNEITVWDVDPDSPTFGAPLTQFLPDGTVLACQYGPDETTYFMSGSDGNIYERDITSNSVVRTFAGHDGIPWDLDTSPDGRYLISCDRAGVVILWDMASGEELRRFNGYSEAWHIAFSPDGQYAFSSHYGGSAIQWQIADWALEDLLAWIPENRYIRELTCEEREKYNITPLCE